MTKFRLPELWFSIFEIGSSQVIPLAKKYTENKKDGKCSNLFVKKEYVTCKEQGLVREPFIATMSQTAITDCSHSIQAIDPKGETVSVNS